MDIQCSNINSITNVTFLNQYTQFPYNPQDFPLSRSKNYYFVLFCHTKCLVELSEYRSLKVNLWLLLYLRIVLLRSLFEDLLTWLMLIECSVLLLFFTH